MYYKISLLFIKHIYVFIFYYYYYLYDLLKFINNPIECTIQINSLYISNFHAEVKNDSQGNVFLVDKR